MPANADPYTEIDLYTVWTPYYRSMWTIDQGFHVFTQVNWTGVQPFKHGFAGFGQMPTRRERVNPRYLAKGLLDPIMESIRMRDQRLIGQHALGMKAAWVKQGTTGDPQQVAKQGEGDMYQGDPNLLWWERPPEIPQWLFQHGSEIDDDIEQGSFTLTLGGFRQTGVSTVGQQAILSGAANKKFAGPIKQLENLYSLDAQGLLKLAVNLKRVGGKESIEVGEWKILESAVHSNFRCFVQFKQIDPIAALQEREQAQNEFTMGLLHKEGYWSVARKENATEIRRGLTEDAVYDMDRVKTLAQAVVLRDFGFRQLADTLESEALAVESENQQFGADGAPISPPSGGGGGGVNAPLPPGGLNQLNNGLTPQNFSPDRPSQQAISEL